MRGRGQSALDPASRMSHPLAVGFRSKFTAALMPATCMTSFESSDGDTREHKLNLQWVLGEGARRAAA